MLKYLGVNRQEIKFSYQKGYPIKTTAAIDQGFYTSVTLWNNQTAKCEECKKKAPRLFGVQLLKDDCTENAQWSLVDSAAGVGEMQASMTACYGGSTLWHHLYQHLH